MPQMAPLYWSLMLVSVWVVLFSACALVWWCLSGKKYSFVYKR